ncbi:MAG: SulP family inorganic anion transporter [Thermoleophilia bacterium]
MNPALRAVSDLAPRGSDYAGLRSHWRKDLVAGLTVAVVALPLALGFGISSGMSAEAGLITAIIAGLVAAIFGGSSVQVSGPTGAMAVVLLPIVAQQGLGAVATVGIVAGLLVVLAGLLRLGRYLAYIPWPVIEGFTLGIAVIIFLQQVPAALGVPRPEGENTAVVAVRAIGDAAGEVQAASILIVAVAAAVMWGSARLHRGIPGSLLAVVVGTLIAEWAGLDVARIGALPGSLPAPSLPSMEPGQFRGLLSAAVAVAALAAIESLLSAKVADGMQDGRPHDPDRELLGQGMANIVAPLFGGMPATGAIARTAVNVRSGAVTRMASIVHALTLAVIVLVAAGLVARIPLAALAGVLMMTAARMVERHNIRAVLTSTRSDALVLAATAAATVAFDLIVAIEIGMVVAAVLALRMLARSARIEETPIDAARPELGHEREMALLDEHIVVYRLDGALFFGAAQRFLATLTETGEVRVVILRLPHLHMIDATGAQTLGQVVENLEERGITVLLKGPRPEHVPVLRAVGVLDRLAHDRHLFGDLDAAVAHARVHVTRALAGVA